MTSPDQSPKNSGSQRFIFEVVAPRPNPPGTHDVQEQDNTATLRNANEAKDIINKLKQK